MTDRLGVIAAALRAPKIDRPYVGHEMRGPMLMLTGLNSDLIWSATIPQIAEAIDQALQEQEEKDIPATGTASTPPLSFGRPADHRRIVAELRAKPGEWRTVGVYRSLATARNVATRLRTASGNYRAYSPAGAFEARTNPAADDARVEARYIGAAPSTTAPAPAPPSTTDDAAWLDALAGLDEEDR
jgi:hypothetical protein